MAKSKCPGNILFHLFESECPLGQVQVEQRFSAGHVGGRRVLYRGGQTEGLTGVYLKILPFELVLWFVALCDDDVISQDLTGSTCFVGFSYCCAFNKNNLRVVSYSCK